MFQADASIAHPPSPRRPALPEHLSLAPVVAPAFQVLPPADQALMQLAAAQTGDAAHAGMVAKPLVPVAVQLAQCFVDEARVVWRELRFRLCHAVPQPGSSRRQTWNLVVLWGLRRPRSRSAPASGWSPQLAEATSRRSGNSRDVHV